MTTFNTKLCSNCSRPFDCPCEWGWSRQRLRQFRGFQTLQNGAGIDGLLQFKWFLPELACGLIVLVSAHAQLIKRVMIGVT